MTHVLFVSEKWCDGDPSKGITNNFYYTFSSLIESKLATLTNLFIDEYYLQFQRVIDEHLVATATNLRPDVIVFSFLIGSGLNPSIPAIARLKELGFPLVFLWFDSVFPHVQHIAEVLAPYSAHSFVLDRSYQSPYNPTKFTQLWTPLGEAYNNPNKYRDIPVSFVGAVENYPDRKFVIEHVQREGLPLMKFGGQRENRLTHEGYIDVLQRSQISVNFSLAPNLLHQIKGRVLESMSCGAMLLESENSEITKWYVPYVHYVPFRDATHLCELIRYFLMNPDKRAQIARQGELKTKSDYTGALFWQKLLSRVLGTPPTVQQQGYYSFSI